MRGGFRDFAILEERARIYVIDSYLDAQTKGALAEAALAGRARALGALGRALEEAAAWRRLLQQIPNTVHRSRAEQRLAQLEQ